jgi:hypothetical protein
MPQALLPAIAAIVGIAGTGFGVVEQLTHSGGAAPKPPTTPAGVTPQQSLQEKALISQQLPNVIGQTSGLTSQNYDELIAQILSGVTGQPGANAAGQAAGNQAFTPANSQPTNAIVNNGVPNLADISSFLG